jgi:hypothetical protein
MTNIHEYEMVQMVAAGLNYDIQKRMFSQHLMDISQLAESYEARTPLGGGVLWCPTLV